MTGRRAEAFRSRKRKAADIGRGGLATRRGAEFHPLASPEYIGPKTAGQHVRARSPAVQQCEGLRDGMIKDRRRKAAAAGDGSAEEERQERVGETGRVRVRRQVSDLDRPRRQPGQRRRSRGRGRLGRAAGTPVAPAARPRRLRGSPAPRAAPGQRACARRLLSPMRRRAVERQPVVAGPHANLTVPAVGRLKESAPSSPPSTRRRGGRARR